MKAKAFTAQAEREAKIVAAPYLARNALVIHDSSTSPLRQGRNSKVLGTTREWLVE
jgi:hypothetical protein